MYSRLGNYVPPTVWGLVVPGIIYYVFGGFSSRCFFGVQSLWVSPAVTLIGIIRLSLWFGLRLEIDTGGLVVSGGG